MPKENVEKLLNVIADAHALGKPIRFWGTPDTVATWSTLHSIGVDYINTDQPEACKEFFRNFIHLQREKEFYFLFV
jgi:alkaline phosphatase